jgi:hypothetical protein
MDACVEFNGVITPIQQNSVFVERLDNSFYISHTYSYYDLSGVLTYGRWSSTDIPLNKFKTIKHMMFRHTIEEYLDEEEGMGVATIRIFFKEKIVAELQAIN